MNTRKGNRSKLQIHEAMKKKNAFYDSTEKSMLNKWYPETKSFSEAQRQDIFQLFGMQLSLAEIDVLRQSFPSRNFAEIKSMFQNQKEAESTKWIEQLLRQRKFNSGNTPGVEKISKSNCDSAWTIINAFQANLPDSQPKKVVENIADCINRAKDKPKNTAIIQTTKLDETHKPHSNSFFADAMIDIENSEKTEIDFQIPSATVQVKNKKNNQVRNIALNPFETTLMFNKVRTLSNELNENIHELVIDFLYRNPDLIEDESIRKSVIDCREKHDKYLRACLIT
jgi:hypothetical protein